MIEVDGNETLILIRRISQRTSLRHSTTGRTCPEERSTHQHRRASVGARRNGLWTARSDGT